MKDNKALVDLLMTAAFVALMLFVVKTRERAAVDAGEPRQDRIQEVAE